jgi:hypothetical protein
MSKLTLDALIAVGGNSTAARKARVKGQPRDKKGRWVVTGAALLAAFSIGDGRGVVKLKGRAIGGTATDKSKVNNIRMLVGKGYEEYGIPENSVVEVTPKNAEVSSKIKIDKDFLKARGVDPDLAHTLPKSVAEQPQDLASLNVQPADELDIELATSGLTTDEDKDFRSERDQEPLAKLPPALAEQALKGEEVNKLVEEPKETVDVKTPLELMAELEKIDSNDPAQREQYIELAERIFGKGGGGPGDIEESETDSKYDGMSQDEKDSELARLLDIFNSVKVRNSANEAYLVAFEQDAPAPDLGKLVKVQAAYSKIKIAKGSALNKGDVITDGKGNEYLVENLRIDVSQGGQSWMEIKDSKGERTRVPLVPSRDYSVVEGSELTPAKPTKPAKPTAKPTKPENPADPTTPEPPKVTTPKKVVPKKAPKSEEVNKIDRADDGNPIAPSEKTDEELRNKKIKNLVDQNGKLIMVENDKGNPRQVEDPNSIIDALLEENPNAKIKEDGTIVVERGSFTDTDGKTYNYEVGVQRTIGNQFMERYTVTDPDSGEVVYDFYNSDYKDSFAGLYGKTSGLTKTRDLLLGRTTPGLKGADAKGVPVEKELRSYFGPDKDMAQRLKYLRKTKDVNNWRLVTEDENISKFLTGRARKLNKSDTGNKKNYRNQFGNVSRSFVASFYEAVDSKDFALVKERLVQLLGRLPNSPESIDKLLSTLRTELGSRYKGTALEKVVQTLPMNLKRFLQSESFDLRNKDQIPFVSEDGVTIVAPGDQVRFINNQGDLVIGTVVRLNAVSGKNGGYKDTAAVRFGDGEVVDNLQTRNMLHTDDAPTPYAKWVRLDEKLRRRADELGIDFEEYAKNRDQDPDFDPEDPDFAGGDANAPYLGEDGESADDASAPSGGTKLAEEMQSGDPLYDPDGGYIGTVQQVKEVPATDGGEPGVAIQYLDIDGNLQTEILDKGEGRGPK